MDTPEQIRSLLEAIVEKDKVLQQKNAAAIAVSIDVDAPYDGGGHVEDLLASAQEEWLAIEREKAHIMSQYGLCQQNNVQDAQTEECRKEIVDAETEVRLADDKISLLEKELKNVSASYKNERERRITMLTNVHAMVNELYEAVSRKVSITTEDAVLEDAPGCLNTLADISREREAECQQWRKYCKETTSIVEMKKERESELQLESEKSVSTLEEVKNQGILALAEKCEAERCAIQAEISELKEIHANQLEQLRSAKLTTDRSGKISQQRNPPARSGIAADKFLEKKLGKHDQERENLEHELRRIATQRQKAVLATKVLQQEIDNDAACHAKLIGHLEVSITAEKQEIATIEQENHQLRDLRDSLSATLRR